jgi:hypothetical protein
MCSPSVEWVEGNSQSVQTFLRQPEFTSQGRIAVVGTLRRNDMVRRKAGTNFGAARVTIEIGWFTSFGMTTAVGELTSFLRLPLAQNPIGTVVAG